MGAVSGLGAAELRQDEWGIDVVVAGSQKALMCPPGLGFASVSERALEYAASRVGGAQFRYYFDWGKNAKAQAKGNSAFTPAVPLFIGLDIALGIGGLPKGRIIEIYGPESSGKTTLTLHVVAEMQKLGGVCAFVDAEHALDPQYAKKLGVNLAGMVFAGAIVLVLQRLLWVRTLRTAQRLFGRGAQLPTR